MQTTSSTRLRLNDKWGPGEWPDRVAIYHEGSAQARVYVPADEVDALIEDVGAAIADLDPQSRMAVLDVLERYV